MFTGIVEAAGIVEELRQGRLVLRTPLAEQMKESGSIAVNGVCLTALEPHAQTFHADLSPETLARTNLGSLKPGSLVNLERPLTPTSELGGHLVQGHVDGVAELVSYRRLDEEGNHWLDVRVPADLLHYVAWKGSVALNGISLTVASLENDILGVAIIPYTHTHTNLRLLQPGDGLNIECDLIARYLERLLAKIQLPAGRAAAGNLTVERLIEEGF
jgi:riboflavin synthase